MRKQHHLNTHNYETKKLLITGLLAIALTTTLQAQNYQSAFGVRLGYDSGLTYKNFFSLGNAFEGILSASPHHFQLTGLYEYQQPVPGAPSLDWYLGLGAHLGGLYDKGHRSNGFLWVQILFLVPNIFFHKPLLPFRSTGNHPSTSSTITTITGTPGSH